MGYDVAADRPHYHPAAHHGLASIAISGIFLLMAVPALQLANTLQRSGYQGFSDTDRQMAAYAGYAGAGVVILLSLIAAGMAVAGIRHAGRTGEPTVLCVSGLLLALFSASVWIGCAPAWHEQARRMLGRG